MFTQTKNFSFSELILPKPFTMLVLFVGTYEMPTLWCIYKHIIYQTELSQYILYDMIRHWYDYLQQDIYSYMTIMLPWVMLIGIDHR